MFNSAILAGFECAHLPWNGHDLLTGTGHVPRDRMKQHYRQVHALGITAARDGLPWRHGVAERMAAAKAAGMQVIWDMDHYWRHPDPYGYAERVALAAYVVNEHKPLWVCPVNEPSIVPMMCPGMDVDAAVALGRGMVAALRRHHHDVRVLTTDAIVHPSGGPWGPTEQLADLADVIGVNVYPHALQSDIAPILIEAHRRFGKPVLISETSWHDGFHHWPGIANKADWLRFVEAEVAEAQAAGVQVAGICWYPIVDCPPWDAPGSDERWSHGLIRQDGGLDPSLSAALRPPGSAHEMPFTSPATEPGFSLLATQGDCP